MNGSYSRVGMKQQSSTSASGEGGTSRSYHGAGSNNLNTSRTEDNSHLTMTNPKNIAQRNMAQQ
jgi:hypothetical protein